MTAAARLRSDSQTQDGLRPLDARRDMKAVAEVIEIAFAGQLDANGERMIRQMKALGRIGWVGWVIAQLFLPPAAYPLGFVWEQAGRVVGNVSLLPAERGSGRWILANVAVIPGYRRRGVARALVTSAVDLAARRGAREIVLQVDVRSEPARRLYEALGFEEQTTRTTWQRPSEASELAAEPDPHVRERRDRDWAQQYALARSLFPEGILWPMPLSADVFRPEPFSGALGFRRIRHWVWYDDSDRVAASLTTRLGAEARHWRLILMVPPDLQGIAEVPLLARGLRALEGARLPAALDYPADRATRSLEALGFRPRRSLTWMRLGLQNGVGGGSGGRFE